ncbi:glutamate--tRNA ligase [Acidianus sp. RZ1]|uniref:glutamate--tRNA ligase n=1 Tax=Acidianus sp. RZ1 TaxID=1540082 RepID=UPI001491B239|nr:glutamate--tRNA ligase [Acidianus sp. RZ1]
MSLNIDELIYKHALANAIKHNGKASVGPVMSKVIGEYPELRNKAKEITEQVKQIVDRVNSLTLNEQLSELKAKFPEMLEERKEKEEKKSLPPLHVNNIFVTRFAPNPDGPIHLGNVRAAIISSEYAKMYNGKFILRFDDTDPKVKKPIKEAYEWIREDLRWLGLSWQEEFKESSRIERYYEVIRELIRNGHAYIDCCTEEEFKKMKETRNFSLQCFNREKEPSRNEELWDKMLSGGFKEGEAVVRIKTDLNDPDPSKIDWVIARIIDTEANPHPIVGSKYIVWPTYNFATVVDDHDFNVTHIFRAKEHTINAEKQKWIYDYMNWKIPEIMEFGRLKLEGFMMSKSKIKVMLEKGLGKDDPRLPTIAGLRRRGILPETIRELIIEVGLKNSDATISFDNLASINRKNLDPTAKRLMYVESFKELELNIDEQMTAQIPLYPGSKEFRQIKVYPGDRIYVNEQDAKDGKVIRLVELCNVRVQGNKAIFTSTDIESAKKEKASIVQWVKASEAVRVRVIKASGDNLEKKEGFGEKAVANLKEGEVVQFVRYGFVRVDSQNEKETVVIYSHE